MQTVMYLYDGTGLAFAWILETDDVLMTSSSKSPYRYQSVSPSPPSTEYEGILVPSTQSQGFLGPYIPNAYGPGINSDATGRPFVWQPDFGGPALGPIRPNVYGPGIGMDGTGRPVRPACPPGWVGHC